MLGEFAVATTSLVIIKLLCCWCVNLLHMNRVAFLLISCCLLCFSVECTKRARILCVCFLVVKLLNLLSLARDFYTLLGEVARYNLSQRKKTNFAIDSRVLEE